MSNSLLPLNRHRQTRSDRLSASLDRAAEEFMLNHKMYCEHDLEDEDFLREIREFLDLKSESEDRGDTNRYYEVDSFSSVSGNPVQVEWFQPETELRIDGEPMQWWEGGIDRGLPPSIAASETYPEAKVQLLARCYSGDFLLTIEEAADE